MNTPRKTSFTFPLDAAAQRKLEEELRHGNYQPAHVPYARVAGDRPDCRIILYTSGKCLVQGKGAQDWVSFVLEPQILGKIVTGYETVLEPEAFAPHMGIDESGKGDFFGPLVIAAVYTDREIVDRLRTLEVRDSKQIRSDAKAERMAAEIRSAVQGRFSVVSIGPSAYNRLYAGIGNVNKLLAWGHARVIENLLEKVPDCPRAVADQFGPERRIRDALMRNGRRIELIQRTKAESDPAVAAASVLARAGFLAALRKLGETYSQPLPKGASAQVKAVAEKLVEALGPEVLLETAKCHFRTTDAVLQASGATRENLGPHGRTKSRMCAIG